MYRYEYRHVTPWVSGMVRVHLPYFGGIVFDVEASLFSACRHCHPVRGTHFVRPILPQADLVEEAVAPVDGAEVMSLVNVVQQADDLLHRVERHARQVNQSGWASRALLERRASKPHSVAAGTRRQTATVCSAGFHGWESYPGSQPASLSGTMIPVVDASG